MAQTPKDAPEKPAPRTKARVLTNASIRDYVEAFMRNLNEVYWQRADPVLDGSISDAEYRGQAMYLNGLRDAGEIARATLAQDDEDDEDSDKDEGVKVGRRPQKARHGARKNRGG